jgi:chaperonin GroEL (HSP60 family)
MEQANFEFIGIDEDGAVANMKEKNIYDVLIVKKHVFRSAVDMAIMLLKSTTQALIY